MSEATAWVPVAEVVERRLAPAPNAAALLARIRRHNRRLPPGHKLRIRTQRGYVALADIAAAAWNRR